MGGIARGRIYPIQLILYHIVMSKSSSLVLGETKVNTGTCRWGRVKHNVPKLCYILSGVGSRVIMGGQKWDVMKAIGVVLWKKGKCNEN